MNENTIEFTPTVPTVINYDVEVISAVRALELMREHKAFQFQDNETMYLLED